MSTFFHFDTGFFKRSRRTRFFPEPCDEPRFFERVARARRLPDFVAKATFTFYEVSIFERLRKVE